MKTYDDIVQRMAELEPDIISGVAPQSVIDEYIVLKQELVLTPEEQACVKRIEAEVRRLLGK